MKYRIIPVTSMAQNTTLCWCPKTRKAVITDPGADVPRILKAISEEEIEVEKILLTHGHFDHIGGAQDLAKRCKVPIYGPDIRDAFLIRQLPQQCQMFGVAELPSFEPDYWMIAGQKITFGLETFEMRFCPGHTPGHLVFINHQAQIGIVGDVLFKEAIGRSDFPGGDHVQLLDSIKTQLFTLPDDFIFIPGHGAISTIGHEKQANPFVY